MGEKHCEIFTYKSGWWFLTDFLFSPRILGEMIQFDEHIFQRGWFNHQLDVDTHTFAENVLKVVYLT